MLVYECLQNIKNKDTLRLSDSFPTSVLPDLLHPNSVIDLSEKIG